MRVSIPEFVAATVADCPDSKYLTPADVAYAAEQLEGGEAPSDVARRINDWAATARFESGAECQAAVAEERARY